MTVKKIAFFTFFAFFHPRCFFSGQTSPISYPFLAISHPLVPKSAVCFGFGPCASKSGRGKPPSGMDYVVERAVLQSGPLS